MQNNFFLRYFPLLLFTIRGNSMMPALSPLKKIFVWKFGKIKKGNIIVFEDPLTGRILIKRVVNIKHNAFFAIGDNTSESTDSRHFGWVEKKYLLGKVIYPR